MEIETAIGADRVVRIVNMAPYLPGVAAEWVADLKKNSWKFTMGNRPIQLLPAAEKLTATGVAYYEDRAFVTRNVSPPTSGFLRCYGHAVDGHPDFGLRSYDAVMDEGNSDLAEERSILKKIIAEHVAAQKKSPPQARAA